MIVVGLLALTRVVSVVPLPGVSGQQLANFFQANQALNLLNLFTGGGLMNISIALMGVGPYITASIIFQLLGYIIPSLESLQKEGEIGRQKINQYTRLAAVPLAIIQSFGTLTLLRNSGVIDSWNASSLLLMLTVSTAGTLFLMWIGELISEYGIGNGMSLIITIGIIAGFENSFAQTTRNVTAGGTSSLNLIVFLAVALITLAVVVMVTEGVRNIPITYARSTRGRGMLGRVNSTLPVKINSAGVIPIIFAISLILIPSIAGQFFQKSATLWIAHTAQFLVTVFDQRHWFYSLAYFVLVFAFSYFYTFIIIKPEEMAENLQRQGGFVPGIRPGNDTAYFIYNVVNRLTFPGALFLGIIAIMPIAIQNMTKIQTISLGGTSILIVVSVVLDTIRQIETQIAARTYEHMA
ncbi:MAG: preprotein translocase subunit SecY [bacterium]|nr:preprotein translocase subunit SecY [bacterium]